MRPFLVSLCLSGYGNLQRQVLLRVKMRAKCVEREVRGNSVLVVLH